MLAEAIVAVINAQRVAAEKYYSFRLAGPEGGSSTRVASFPVNSFTHSATGSLLGSVVQGVHKHTTLQVAVVASYGDVNYLLDSEHNSRQPTTIRQVGRQASGFYDCLACQGCLINDWSLMTAH